MTQGKELLRHPVVEKLAMIGIRSAIPEQDRRKSTKNLRAVSEVADMEPGCDRPVVTLIRFSRTASDTTWVSFAIWLTLFRRVC